MSSNTHPPFLLFRNISLTYESKDTHIEALRDINFSVNAGEFVSIVGPSGCGKTTLLKLASGLLKPTKGELFFKGNKVNEIVKGVGMAFQDALLLPWRNILDNVLLPIEILKRSKEEFIEKAEELLTIVDIKGFGNKFPWELSGGMQQRANLCRALIHDPEILLLDEPFGALDAFTREKLWLIAQDLHQKIKCTTVLVTHYLPEAVFLSDRIIVLCKRPGTVADEEKVSIPRPRPTKFMYTEEFLDYELRLREKMGMSVK